jgi:hypothetical protein
VAGAGEIVAVASSIDCTRDKSRDNGGRKKGERRKAAKDRFQVDGHPNGSLQLL